jgi:superfamily II DNA or RNA helicase
MALSGKDLTKRLEGVKPLSLFGIEGVIRLIELRPYQRECIEAIETADNTGTHRQLVALPTGTGKTIIFTTVAKKRNGRTLILAHRDELIQQAVDKLEMVWDDANVGVVKAERNETDKQIIVGSVQTVSRENRLEQLPTDFDFICTDESHHAPSISYRRIYEYLGVMANGDEDIPSDTLHLGVTATPERTDKIGLNGIFDKIVFHRNILDFIPDYLCDLRCVQVATYVNVDGVDTWAGDLDAGQLAKLLNTANCNELIVEAWKEHALERLTLVFTTDVAHARDLCAAFQAADIKAAWVSGETPIDERRDILARFASGEIEVLTNCAVLTEGYDNCALDCIILARPTKSKLLYTQMLGRGTRTYPGKEDCLILDVACVSTEHDLVSFPSLFGLEPEQDGEKTLTEQLEEKEAKIYGLDLGRGLEHREVDLFDREERTHDDFAMSNLAWVQLKNGFRLSLGKDGVINIYSDFKIPAMYRVFYRNKSNNRHSFSLRKQQVTTRPVELSWAFGLAESEARRVTGGNLVLVDKNAYWRRKPASVKQLAILSQYGIYRASMTKGEASDLISKAFARALD